MLVLAIETSSRRGSVALVESGQLLANAWHDEPNAHGERLLGLIDDIFNRAGRNRRQLGRVAVGRGPGAFTGLRIGLALARGIGAALGIPAIGISSLRAMAAAVPGHEPGNRWPLIDARRGELFVACYSPDGVELVSPRVVPLLDFSVALPTIRSNLGKSTDKDVLIGNALANVQELAVSIPGFQKYHNDASDWPGANAVAQLALTLSDTTPASPEYLRDADAVLPKLPPCPLTEPYRSREP